MPRPIWASRVLKALVLLAFGAAACRSSTAPEANAGLPAGPDVDIPFPIDRGDDGAHTPGSYKGLPLRLTAGESPNVTPVDGVIGVVCVGMSNAKQECDTYRTLLESEWSDEVDPAVQVVNCAQGGHAIERWIDPAFDDSLWRRCVDQLLPAAGLRVDQVRVLYHKAANQFTTGPGGAALPPFPDPTSDHFAFRRNLSAFAARVTGKFPTVQAVYTSSRSYGGYASNAVARGEPLSYEEGHALNTWLAENRSVAGVWYGWGPYLWAPACSTGVNNGSGVCYDRADYVDDGVHPSDAGRATVARMIHDRFMQEAWYRR